MLETVQISGKTAPSSSEFASSPGIVMKNSVALDRFGLARVRKLIEFPHVCRQFQCAKLEEL